MALPTFLDTVNNVLIRLREQEVSSVTDTEYSKLISVFVNDSKREVENAADWSMLRSTVVVSTLPGVSTYSLTGAGTSYKVMAVLNDTTNVEMKFIPDKEVQKNNYLYSVAPGEPTVYTIKGVDSNGDSQVTFFPTPDVANDIRFELVITSSDLVANTDPIKTPVHLTQLLAYAKAISERGEDGGQMYVDVYKQYLVNLADAVSIDRNRLQDEMVWEAS